MSPIKWSVLVFVCFSLLVGCLSPVKTPSITTYTLSAQSGYSNARVTRAQTIWVTTPVANPGYQSSQMMYRLYPYQLASFSKNRWAAPPAAMLAPLLVQSLKNSGHFHAVVRVPAGQPDYRLDTQLLQLEQQFYQRPSVVVMTLQVQLIDNHNQQIIFDRRFSCVIATRQNDPYSGVVAANEATQRLLDQITRAVTNSL